MGTHIRFNDSDAEYQPSDSEDELSDSEKRMLKNVRNRGKTYSDSEDEVLGVDASESDEQSDLALSDVEGQGEDDDYGIPDAKAWGKKKRNYYSTDYVDPDYGGFQGRDATMAEMEEEEARNLQSELAKTMDDADFALDLFGKGADTKEKGSVQPEEVIKTDVSKLSKRQKLQLMEKESPEFFGLVQDYETKMNVVQEFLRPCIQLWKQKKIQESKALEFVNTYNELILNYCTNIHMYLLLKANKVNIQNHPIVKRLYQFRQLFTQMDPVFTEVVQSQIELILAQNADKKVPAEIIKKKKTTLKLLSDLNKQEQEKSDSKKKKSKKAAEFDDAGDGDERPKKKKKVAFEESPSDEVPIGIGKMLHDSSDESPEEEEEEKTTEVLENGEVGKRGITYQIAKNKGLMPHRKKELRNPRVKHRNKFRKAQIRRKGAVREVRQEMARYGGEISGIKATVSKSIKIRT